jgi:pyruvate dehydrogenase E1 component beta subunit
MMGFLDSITCLRRAEEGPRNTMTDDNKLLLALYRDMRRTHRAMVVTGGPLTGGFSAELSARIHESCFDPLEEPVARVTGEDIPIPVSPSLERNAVPNAQLIAETGLWLTHRKAPAWAS